MRLVIVESPAKCSKIQGFLGPGYKVIASMGHIRGLVPDLESVGINKAFEPTYEFSKIKAKAIAQLRASAKEADTIILCADDDREGEAIAYSVAVLLKLDPRTNPRAAFREITKTAVCDAIQRPRTINMNRVNSQQARAMLDMMVGFTI
jgi:DNA topoisomerase-1